MIVILTVFSLFAGLACGFFGLGETVFSALRNNTDLILYVLMFCVGIMIGIREYHLRIFIIPAGIIAGSVLGGMLCAALLKMPVAQGAAIAGGMGWYSLAGATIGNLCGAEAGSIAFLSNLMREIFSFFIIPFLAVKFNYYTCIAPAGATSEASDDAQIYERGNGGALGAKRHDLFVFRADPDHLISGDGVSLLQCGCQ